MKKLIIRCLLLTAFAILTLQTAAAQTQKENSAVSTRTTADNSAGDVSDQKYDDLCAKAAAEAAASRTAINDLQKGREKDASVIAGQMELLRSFLQLVQSKDTEIQNLRGQIGEMRCTTTVYFFGLKKKKECR